MVTLISKLSLLTHIIWYITEKFVIRMLFSSLVPVQSLQVYALSQVTCNLNVDFCLIPFVLEPFLFAELSWWIFCLVFLCLVCLHAAWTYLFCLVYSQSLCLEEVFMTICTSTRDHLSFHLCWKWQLMFPKEWTICIRTILFIGIWRLPIFWWMKMRYLTVISYTTTSYMDCDADCIVMLLYLLI